MAPQKRTPKKKSPKKKHLGLAIVCIGIATVASLTDWQLANRWLEVNTALEAVPPLMGLALAGSIFGWLLLPPTLALAAYECAGGDANQGIRDIFEAIVRRIGGSDSEDDSKKDE